VSEIFCLHFVVFVNLLGLVVVFLEDLLTFCKNRNFLTFGGVCAIVLVGF
jgi:hypothetical protein